MQFQPQQFAAAVAQAAHGGAEAFEHLLALHVAGGVGVQVRQLDVGDGYLVVLPAADVLAPLRHDLKAHNLQRKRQQVFGPVQVRVFFMQEHEHLLSQILGGVPR